MTHGDEVYFNTFAYGPRPATFVAQYDDLVIVLSNEKPIVIEADRVFKTKKDCCHAAAKQKQEEVTQLLKQIDKFLEMSLEA